MLWTFQDTVKNLLAFLGNDTTEKGRSDCRRAAQDALRDLTNLHRWSYLQTFTRVVTVASYSTGTVAYDHTGGANERQVTLTGGTWPTWAAYGSIIINSVHYEVYERVSDTIITLKSDSNPGDDVASGASFQIYRDAYPLPSNFGSIDEVFRLDDMRSLAFVQPMDWYGFLNTNRTPGDPTLVTVMGDPNYQDTMAMRFAPPPSAAVNYEFCHYRAVRQLLVEEYKTGTVTGTSDSAAITGTGTAWTSAHVGCSIRLGTATVDPTGPESAGSGLAAVERVITEVGSPTSITVDSALGGNFTNVKYVISDIVDIRQQSMLNAFKAACKSSLGSIRRMQDQQSLLNDFMLQVRRAMAADNQSHERLISGGGSGVDSRASVLFGGGYLPDYNTL